MTSANKARLVPCGMVSPGFEAVYTGEESPTPLEPTGWPIVRRTDDEGNVIQRWSVWTWRSDPAKWDDEIRAINVMQEALGPLDDDTRQVRAHIGSLVLCEPGIPATIDELLAAIGRGRFLEPPLHNGCWCGGMWWDGRGSQHGQVEAMQTIEDVLRAYLAGEGAEEVARRFPDAEGFIRRACGWLPPVGELSELQRLMIERMLLPFEFFAKRSDDYEQVNADCFGPDGRGAELDRRIAELAGLPPIRADWTQEFRRTLAGIAEADKRDLYAICGGIAHGLHGLSDCHHSMFRWIERWVHDIGTLSMGIPARPAGTERRRLAKLLLGYCLGLDKWLLGRSMQFLLMDLAYLDLPCDPKNEILRVYAHLGPGRTPVKLWLAACLWKVLSGVGNPRGLVIQKELNERAAAAGVSTRQWMDRLLRAGPGGDSVS